MKARQLPFPSMLLPLIFMAASSAGHAQTMGPPQAAQPQEPMNSTPAETRPLAKTDMEFVNKAASANMFEIQAAKLAQSKSTDTAITSFAQKMIDDHGKIGDEMNALAHSRGATLPPDLMSSDQKDYAKLQQAASGKTFDKDYAKEMVSSHEKAIRVFKDAVKHSKDQDIKTFASQTLPTLEDHLNLAKALQPSSH